MQEVRLKRTFGQLKKALEDGNAKYVFPQSQISRCCNEMAKIGVDIEQLEAEIAGKANV
jgi:chemotaxis receptor (MCP) glutamine deamidase CheD